MIFGQNYFDVLTSRIGGASNSWNRQGLSNVNSKGRTTGARGSSRTSSAGNSYYWLSANTIKAMNNAYNTTANKSYIICLADMEDTALFFLQCSPVGFNRALFNEVNKA